MGQRVPIIKAQPTVSDVHVNAALTTLSVGFAQDESSFVAGKVFPVVPVMKQSDAYFELARADWFRSDARKRSPGAESAGSGYGVSTSTYFAHKYAIHKDVSDDVRQNSDSALQPDADATRYCTQQLLLLREKTWVANYFVSGIWTGETSPANWSNSGGDPINDIHTGSVGIARLTGRRPNTLVVSPEVHQALTQHDDIMERIKYTQTGVVTEALLAALFGLDNYYVTWATENTSNEGDATPTYAFVAGDHALLCYVPPNPGINVPAAGYTFSWTGLLGAGALGNRVKRFRMEHLESDRIEGEMAFDLKMVAADLGHLFLDVTS